MNYSDMLRFSRKIIQQGNCFVWTGYTRGKYGAMEISKRKYGVHRISWEFFNHKKIPENVVVMHICDNPICIRPEHLKIGTKADNEQDKNLKKRGNFNRCGEFHPTSKFSNKSISQLRRLYKGGGYSIRILASAYKICESHCAKIIHNIYRKDK